LLLTTIEEAVMRRCLLTAVFTFVILAMLAPAVFAQTPPPAPKVTITGTFDQFTSAGRNFYDGNYSRDNDREWYARTRFRPDFEFAVGRTKAVLGLEIDLMYGQGGSNDGGFPGNVSGAAGGLRRRHQERDERRLGPEHRRRRHDRDQVDLHGVRPDG
jgi:hypothetical protein